MGHTMAHNFVDGNIWRCFIVARRTRNYKYGALSVGPFVGPWCLPRPPVLVKNGSIIGSLDPAHPTASFTLCWARVACVDLVLLSIDSSILHRFSMEVTTGASSCHIAAITGKTKDKRVFKKISEINSERNIGGKKGEK